MRIIDFQANLELVKLDILSSEAEYLKLLEVVGNNQRYDFISQLSIYDKKPNATACGEYDLWPQRFNRVVIRGQKGIPVLENNNVFQKVGYIFDISQTKSLDRNINEFKLWQFDKDAHGDVLKEMIKSEGYSEYESIADNIFCLSKLYGDEKLEKLITELGIATEYRPSFVSFVRNSISYAVAAKFQVDYQMDNEVLKENFARLDSTSFTTLGKTLSDISRNIIETTMRKSKEMEFQKGVLRIEESEYNKINHEIEKASCIL